MNGLGSSDAIECLTPWVCAWSVDLRMGCSEVVVLEGRGRHKLNKWTESEK